MKCWINIYISKRVQKTSCTCTNVFAFFVTKHEQPELGGTNFFAYFFWTKPEHVYNIIIIMVYFFPLKVQTCRLRYLNSFFSGLIHVPTFHETNRNVTVYSGEYAILKCTIENLGPKMVSRWWAPRYTCIVNCSRPG